MMKFNSNATYTATTAQGLVELPYRYKITFDVKGRKVIAYAHTRQNALYVRTDWFTYSHNFYLKTEAVNAKDQLPAFNAAKKGNWFKASTVEDLTGQSRAQLIKQLNAPKVGSLALTSY